MWPYDRLIRLPATKPRIPAQVYPRQVLLFGSYMSAIVAFLVSCGVTLSGLGDVFTTSNMPPILAQGIGVLFLIPLKSALVLRPNRWGMFWSRFLHRLNVGVVRVLPPFLRDIWVLVHDPITQIHSAENGKALIVKSTTCLDQPFTCNVCHLVYLPILDSDYGRNRNNLIIAFPDTTSGSLSAPHSRQHTRFILWRMRHLWISRRRIKQGLVGPAGLMISA